MIALQVTSLKNLMNQLLIGDTFDCFLLEEAIIRTGVTYTIDGHVNREFYADVNTFDSTNASADIATCPYPLQPWSEAKGLCFDLIKGKRTPLYFKFVLQVKPDCFGIFLSDIPEQINAPVLTIKYDGTKALLTTGTSYKTFVLDKETDRIWDTSLTKYLTEKEIPYEVL